MSHMKLSYRPCIDQSQCCDKGSYIGLIRRSGKPSKGKQPSKLTAGLLISTGLSLTITYCSHRDCQLTAYLQPLGWAKSIRLHATFECCAYYKLSILFRARRTAQFMLWSYWSKPYRQLEDMNSLKVTAMKVQSTFFHSTNQNNLRSV